jgi:hypothetical protein
VPGLARGPLRSGFRVTIGFDSSIESIFSTIAFTSLRGRPYPSVVSGRASHPHVNSLSVDAPEGISLPDRLENRVSSASAIRLLGTNVRVEASFLATRLRREQNRRPLLVASVLPFSSLRLRHNHLGSSTRTCVALLQNRLPRLSRIRVKSPEAADRLPRLLVGVEALRGRVGTPLESFARTLSTRRLSRG